MSEGEKHKGKGRSGYHDVTDFAAELKKQFTIYDVIDWMDKSNYIDSISVFFDARCFSLCSALICEHVTRKICLSDKLIEVIVHLLTCGFDSMKPLYLSIFKDLITGESALPVIEVDWFPVSESSVRRLVIDATRRSC